MEEGLKVSFLGDLSPLKAAFKEAADGVQRTANTINKTVASIGQGVRVEPIRVKVDVDKIVPPQLPTGQELKIPVSLIPPKQLPNLKAGALKIESVILPPKLPSIAPIDIPINLDTSTVVSQIDSMGAALQAQIPSWQQLNGLFHGIFHSKFGHEGMTYMSQWRKEVEAGKITFTDFIKRLNLTEEQTEQVSAAMKKMGYVLADAPKRGIKSLQQLQDQLKRLEAGLKTATNPESMARLQRAIDATKARMQSLNADSVVKSFDGIKKSSNTAGMAVMDFGRILQDMPYGIRGVANNLNPMLESFQRLKVETGSTKAALSAMVGSLSGPMGIGIAVAAVSSLLVAFGDNLFESGQKVAKFKGEAEAMTKALEDSKEAFDNLAAAVEFLNQLGSINIKINGLGDLQDLREQNAANMQLVVDAEIREADLKKIFSDAADKLEKNKIEKRNLFGELISTEYDPDLKAAFDRAEKDLKDHQYKLSGIMNTGRLLTRRIELQKIEDAKDAAEKEKALNEKRLEAWKKYLEGVKQVQEMLRAAYAKIAMGDVDMGDVPDVKPPTDWVGEFNKNLKQQYDKAQAQDLPLPGFDVQLFEAEKKELIEEYRQLFKSIGKELPKGFDFGGGLKLELKDMNTTQLKEQLGGLFEGMRSQVQQAADMISGVLTPAFQGMFAAITSGENPLQAFFNSLKVAIDQLISQLIAAAVKALVLRMITGGGSMAVPQMSRITSVRAFASGGIIKGPTLGLMGEYAGARNNPEVVAPLNKLRGMIAGTGGGNVTVTGRLRGGDIILSNNRTTRKQKGRR